jgi:hypothetical protein
MPVQVTPPSIAVAKRTCFLWPVVEDQDAAPTLKLQGTPRQAGGVTSGSRKLPVRVGSGHNAQGTPQIPSLS